MIFIRYMERIITAAQIPTEENFAEIQRIQSAILNCYAAGRLSDLEKQTLYNATTIVMDNMRKELRIHEEGR